MVGGIERNDMKRKTFLAVIALGVALSVGLGGYALSKYFNKKAPSVCVEIESKNDLEVCEFSQATVIVSRGGQTIYPKPSASPKPADKK